MVCATVQQHETSYHLNIECILYNLAACYFEMITIKAYMDTNATARNFHFQIRLSPEYIATINYAITKFNIYVCDCIKELPVRG
jgi:hypothetical protein